MLKFSKRQKSEDYLALLAEERAKSDGEHIAKILAKKKPQAMAPVPASRKWRDSGTRLI